MRGIRIHSGVGATVVGVLAAATLFAGGIALASVTAVGLGPSGPQPATVTVQWGDTVVFRNDDVRAHAVTIPRTGANSPLIAPGGTWTNAFDGRAGSYFFRQTEGGRGYVGSIIVQLTGTVTLASRPETVEFGKSVTFSGTAPRGHRVTLEHLRVASSGQWAEIVTVTAGADGTWSTPFVPKVSTRFRATAAAGQLRSAAVKVGVQPKVALLRPIRARAGKVSSVRARVQPAVAAATADLERYDTNRRRWLLEDRRKVGAGGIVSFRWESEKGRSQLRVVLRRYALRPGFEPVESKPVIVKVS